MTSADVAAAETKALEARARLNGTVEALQAELEPQKLVRVARAEVIDGSGKIARAGITAARRNPAAIAGAGALLVAFLARKPIARLLTRSRRHRHAAPPIVLLPQTSAERMGS